MNNFATKQYVDRISGLYYFDTLDERLFSSFHYYKYWLRNNRPIPVWLWKHLLRVECIFRSDIFFKKLHQSFGVINIDGDNTKDRIVRLVNSCYQIGERPMDYVKAFLELSRTCKVTRVFYISSKLCYMDVEVNFPKDECFLFEQGFENEVMKYDHKQTIYFILK